jgi:hypothetical protein
MFMIVLQLSQKLLRRLQIPTRVDPCPLHVSQSFFQLRNFQRVSAVLLSSLQRSRCSLSFYRVCKFFASLQRSSSLNLQLRLIALLLPLLIHKSLTFNTCSLILALPQLLLRLQHAACGFVALLPVFQSGLGLGRFRSLFICNIAELHELELMPDFQRL